MIDLMYEGNHVIINEKKITYVNVSPWSGDNRLVIHLDNNEEILIDNSVFNMNRIKEGLSGV